MEIKFHPLVKQDIAEALRYYHSISIRLGDEFFDEVRSMVNQAAGNPLRFHVDDRGFRRANLRRFPHHILYEIRGEVLRVMHVRHNKRHPEYGKERT